MTLSLVLRRLALIAPLVAVTAMVATPSCDPYDDARADDLDRGGTLGAEVAVTVVGRGRVTSTPLGVDCPSGCFARILLADEAIDGGTKGVTLVAEPTPGASFEGWSFEELDRGARARGPAACSPMTRKSVVPAVDATSRAISLAFGESIATPPRGREEECAGYTSVSIAYVVTATFADVIDVIDAGNDGLVSDPGAEVVFDAPADAQGSVATEIGVAGGYVYWRYQLGAQSGVAGGFSGFRGGKQKASVLLATADPITRFDVDQHVAIQDASGAVHAIAGGNDFPVRLGDAPPCAALASDVASVLCRANDGAGSTLYAWAVNGGPSSIVHRLPLGSDLATDGQRIYFSEGSGAGGAIVESAPRGGDGSAPLVTRLVFGQTSPQSLSVGPSYLFWIDDLGNGSFNATSGSKFSTSTARVASAGSSVRFVAADPSEDSFWIGVLDTNGSTGTILHAFPSVQGPSPMPFRTGIVGLGGIAVDNAYVYWTQSDGRVYRKLKSPEL